MTREAGREASAPTTLRRSWEAGYAWRLFSTDLVVLVFAVGGSQVLWFGLEDSDLAFGARTSIAIGYTLVSATLVVSWMLFLQLMSTRDRRVVGSGSLEYRRVAEATFAVFGFFAIVGYLGKIDFARGYLLTALPVGVVLVLVARWSWRQWLNRRRQRGEFVSKVLIIGSREKTEHVGRGISREPTSGLVLAAALVPHGKPGETVAGAPVLGDFTSIIDALEESGADTIVLTDSDDLPHTTVRTLSWDLEARGVSLIVVPALTDVAGPRIHARPVAGLPLIHVEFPTFEGRKHVAKRAFDLVAATVGLVLLSPLFLVISAAVRGGSPGPAFFRQERVGINGLPFMMLKFRSMTSDAESQLSSLLDQSQGSGPLFKLKNDPRVTPVGRFLRSHSLDELPQLINVVRGQMSLVGPRPPLANEVESYDHSARRRLLVKPGVTGLWQVSGRSNLSWDDSVRLDLYYVENWSLTGDLIILYRTVRAVLRPEGAY